MDGWMVGLGFYWQRVTEAFTKALSFLKPSGSCVWYFVCACGMLTWSIQMFLEMSSQGLDTSNLGRMWAQASLVSMVMADVFTMLWATIQYTDPEFVCWRYCILRTWRNFFSLCHIAKIWIINQLPLFYSCLLLNRFSNGVTLRTASHIANFCFCKLRETGVFMCGVVLMIMVYDFILALSPLSLLKWQSLINCTLWDVSVHLKTGLREPVLFIASSVNSVI